MSLDGIASMQSHIAAIQEKVTALSNQGRPPVAVTELGGKSLASAGVAGVASTAIRPTSPFASEYAKQIASTGVDKSGFFHERGVIQGRPDTAEVFVQRVKSYIEVSYVWGGTNPAKGLDCSGLIRTVTRGVGMKLPHVTYDQQHAGEKVNGIENTRPGDLIICHKSGHVAVYIGDNRVIHTPCPGENVTEISVKGMGPIDTIRRMMRSENDLAPTVTTGPTAAATRRLAFTAALASLETNVGFNPSGDLASTLVNQPSGQSRVSGAYRGTRQGGIGTTSANTTLLSQLMDAGTVANPALNPLAGATPDVMPPLGGAASITALNITTHSLGVMSALRSALGV